MKQYIVDAFTDRVFHGNPAAVCVLEGWPEEETVMDITRENNLSETAFCVWEGQRYHLRWFTPGGEIDLCGHATLATASVILRYIHPDWQQVEFDTMSGLLTVLRRGELYEMDFPAYQLREVPVTEEMSRAIGYKPLRAYMGRDLLCVLENEAQVRECSPDMEQIKALEGLLLHITAPGAETDCISRSFAPKLNVPEDPVCGSGHCHIVPYWAQQLGRTELVAYQASRRGGTLYCTLEGDRVRLSGKAVTFSCAEITC